MISNILIGLHLRERRLITPDCPRWTGIARKDNTSQLKQIFIYLVSLDTKFIKIGKLSQFNLLF